MPALGELYDTASARLEQAGAVLPDVLEPSRRAALATELERLLSALQRDFGPSAVTQAGTVTSDLAAHLRMAQDNLVVALRFMPGPHAAGGDPARALLSEATHAVLAVRDVIESHRSADRIPLTPYAYHFSSQSSLDYLTRRTADVAWHASRISHGLTRGAEHPGIVDALTRTHKYLDQAAVFGRTGTQRADQSASAFPLALPVEPVQAPSSEPTHWLPSRLADDCERLSRAAFEIRHSRGEHRLSGSDIQHLSRSAAMSRLLAGRLLLRVAEQHPDPATSEILRHAANHLREAAKAWQEAAAEWRRIVDVADPRAHPKLPPPSYDVVRLGQVVHLPQVIPHPAAVIAHTSVVRLGRLLYGPQWRPDQPARPPAQARAAGEILIDTRGEGLLAAMLYRLPATGRQLALAVPAAIQRAASGLVTDSPEHRPAGLDPRIRWYPIHDHQADRLSGAYEAVERAEQAASAALLRVAQTAGTAVPRALLDAVAHSQLTAAPGDRGTPDRARMRQQERATAALARSTGQQLPPTPSSPRPGTTSPAATPDRRRRQTGVYSEEGATGPMAARPYNQHSSPRRPSPPAL